MAFRRDEVRIAPQKVIRVKQEHIDLAEKAKSRTCAIAAALAEQGVLRPIVHRGRVAFTVNGERFSYIVPPSMAEYITAFDADKHKVRPKEFRLYEGRVYKAKRTGGPDRTQKARHKTGGRKARKGFTGHRPIVTMMSTRLDGFAQIKREQP